MPPGKARLGNVERKWKQGAVRTWVPPISVDLARLLAGEGERQIERVQHQAGGPGGADVEAVRSGGNRPRLENQIGAAAGGAARLGLCRRWRRRDAHQVLRLQPGLSSAGADVTKVKRAGRHQRQGQAGAQDLPPPPHMEPSDSIGCSPCLPGEQKDDPKFTRGDTAKCYFRARRRGWCHRSRVIVNSPLLMVMLSACVRLPPSSSSRSITTMSPIPRV